MDYSTFFQQSLALIIVWCAFYGLVIRPGRVAEKERRAAVKRLKKGSLVITTHGMRGVVRDFDDSRQYIEVEIAHEVVCSLSERGIARILPSPPDEEKEVSATADDNHGVTG